MDWVWTRVWTQIGSGSCSRGLVDCTRLCTGRGAAGRGQRPSVFPQPGPPEATGVSEVRDQTLQRRERDGSSRPGRLPSPERLVTFSGSDRHLRLRGWDWRD